MGSSVQHFRLPSPRWRGASSLESPAEVDSPGVGAGEGVDGGVGGAIDGVGVVFRDEVPAIIDEEGRGGGGFLVDATGKVVVAVFGDEVVCAFLAYFDEAVLGIPGVEFAAIVGEVSILVVNGVDGGTGGDGIVLIELVRGVGDRSGAVGGGGAVSDAIEGVCAVLGVVAVVGIHDLSTVVVFPNLGGGSAIVSAVGLQTLADTVDGIGGESNVSVGDGGDDGDSIEIPFSLENVAMAFPSVFHGMDRGGFGSEEVGVREVGLGEGFLGDAGGSVAMGDGADPAGLSVVAEGVGVVEGHAVLHGGQGAASQGVVGRLKLAEKGNLGGAAE